MSKRLYLETGPRTDERTASYVLLKDGRMVSGIEIPRWRCRFAPQRTDKFLAVALGSEAGLFVCPLETYWGTFDRYGSIRVGDFSRLTGGSVVQSPRTGWCQPTALPVAVLGWAASFMLDHAGGPEIYLDARDKNHRFMKRKYQIAQKCPDGARTPAFIRRVVERLTYSG